VISTIAIEERINYIVVTSAVLSAVVYPIGYRYRNRNIMIFYWYDVQLLPFSMYITKYNNLLPKMQEYNQILLLLSTSKSINTMDFYIILLNMNLQISTLICEFKMQKYK
jgi:hypothetical protein